MRPDVPSLEALIAGAGQLGSLPATFRVLNEVANDPSSSAHQVGLVVEKDPALALRMLRLANSPFYSFPSRVTTVSQAVVLIGMRQLRDLVLATSVIELFKGISPDLVDMDSFWRHGIATGITARILANRLQQPDGEYFFIAGLLHDIGSLLMYQTLPIPCRDVMLKHEATGLPLHHLEIEQLGYHHAEVGGALLRAWHLPAALSNPVMRHHAPDAKAEQYRETSIVHIADVIADSLEFGSNGERNVPPLDRQAWDAVQMERVPLAEIVPEIEFQFDSVTRIFLSDAKTETKMEHLKKYHETTKSVRNPSLTPAAKSPEDP